MHAIVTGASSGIGAAIAQELSSAGYGLTLVARRQSLLEELAETLKGPTHIVAKDLADPPTACDFIEGAVEALGPVDVLVNNAGMQIIGPTSEVDVERGEMLLRLNVMTPFRLTRAVLPAMLERRKGAIVDIASMAALAPTPGMYYYNASKGALAAASEALRGELRETGVHVVTVYPGIIETDMGKKGLDAYESTSLLDMQPRGTTDGLARLIRQAIDKRRDRVIYPKANAVARWFPGTTRWMMDRFTPPMTSSNEDT